jgi:hypothetical protein
MSEQKIVVKPITELPPNVECRFYDQCKSLTQVTEFLEKKNVSLAYWDAKNKLVYIPIIK